VDAGAEVGPEAVVGAARIRRSARVERAVVWDGTEIAAGERVVDAIAAGADRVRAAG
jgi:NDP-sugar pyrophosphorylase family protein